MKKSYTSSDFWHSFDLSCPQHQFQLPLRFLSEFRTESGDIIAVYGCHCGYSEGWTADSITGQPRRLWAEHRCPNQ